MGSVSFLSMLDRVSLSVAHSSEYTRLASPCSEYSLVSDSILAIGTQELQTFATALSFT